MFQIEGGGESIYHKRLTKTRLGNNNSVVTYNRKNGANRYTKKPYKNISRSPKTPRSVKKKIVDSTFISVLAICNAPICENLSVSELVSLSLTCVSIRNMIVDILVDRLIDMVSKMDRGNKVNFRHDRFYFTLGDTNASCIFWPK